MVRPERFELPTFWFVARILPTQQHKPNGNRQKTQAMRSRSFGCFWFVLYPVLAQN